MDNIINELLIDSLNASKITYKDGLVGSYVLGDYSKIGIMGRFSAKNCRIVSFSSMDLSQSTAQRLDLTLHIGLGAGAVAQRL